MDASPNSAANVDLLRQLLLGAGAPDTGQLYSPQDFSQSLRAPGPDTLDMLRARDADSSPAFYGNAGQPPVNYGLDLSKFQGPAPGVSDPVPPPVVQPAPPSGGTGSASLDALRSVFAGSPDAAAQPAGPAPAIPLQPGGAGVGAPPVPGNTVSAYQIANAAQGNGLPGMSPDVQQMLDAYQSAGSDPGARIKAAAAASAGVGASDANVPPGSHPSDHAVAQPPAGVPAAGPLPTQVQQAVAGHGFKLPANTWDALIAFGAGLMKNSGQPHFAQAAGAALESATAVMTDQQKTTFNQQLEARKVLAAIDQHRDQLALTAQNQTLSHQDRQAAIQERAQATADRTQLMGIIAGGNQDLRATIAQGNQTIQQQNANTNVQNADMRALAEQNTAATRADSAANRAASNATSAQSRADTFEQGYRKTLDNGVQGTMMTDAQKEMLTLSRTAARHPDSTQSQIWQERKGDLVGDAKRALAGGAPRAAVMQRLQQYGIGAADLQ